MDAVIPKELLTEKEAATYLCVDTINVKDPCATVRRYRTGGKLKGVRLGKAWFYQIDDLRAFVRFMQEQEGVERGA